MHPVRLLTLKEQEQIYDELNNAIADLIAARDKFLKGENANCINRTFDAHAKTLTVLQIFVSDRGDIES